jgi:hypothetical protein
LVNVLKLVDVPLLRRHELVDHRLCRWLLHLVVTPIETTGIKLIVEAGNDRLRASRALLDKTGELRRQE